MSTRPGIFLCLLALPWAVYAQSASLLEALRTQTPNHLQRAEEELAQCQKTSCPQLHNLLLLVGAASLSQGENPKALEYLKAAANAPSSSLAPFAYWYLAQAHAQAQALPAALFYLKKTASGPPWLQAKARLRTAELQFLRRQFASALKTLEGQPNKSPEALFLLSQCYLSLKQYDKALQPLQQLAVHMPNHPHGVWAEEALSQIALARLPAFQRKPKERLLRTQNLVAAGAHSNALAELQRLPKKLSPAHQAEAAFWLARVHFAQGKAELAKPHLESALKGPPKTAQQAAWFMARRHMRRQENALAREWLAKAAAQGVAKLSEEARFMSAWLWLNEAQWNEAEKALGAFAAQHPRSSFAVDARWFQGWAQFRQGNCGSARQTWLEAAGAYAKSPLLPQFQYWAARCAPQTNEAEKEAVRQAFQMLAAQFPGSLYGRMAKERLQSAEPLFPVVSPLPVSPLPAQLGLAQALAQAGLWADAQMEFEAVRKRTRGSEEALRVGAALQSLGAFDVAYALAARNLWAAAFSRKEGPALALLFPKAFEAEVLAASKTFSLPPALIWAVMRRESAFSVNALSSANARGLMQIIPPTGRRIAEQRGLPPPSPEELFSPALNIPFGSWYLQKLTERFGHLAPALAAYNAGPKAVMRWLNARGKLPLDEWVEEIPFRETRNYVKQVLPDVYAFTEMYAELADSPPPAWEWVLAEPQLEGVNF